MRKWENSTRTRMYTAWRNMRRRCCDPKDDSYKYYGARGITIDVSWLNDFDAFARDMGHPPDGMSLDRIDNAKGYGPDNCRWATLSEQMNNRSDNARLVLDGVSLTQAQWARHLGIKEDTLGKRLTRMPVRDALVVSRKKEWKHGTRHGYEIGCRCDECKAVHAKRFRDRRAAAK